jgi:hypothetical protein
VNEPIITIVQGETLRLRVSLRNKRTGSPVDLTGASISSQVRRTYADPAVLATLTIEPEDLSAGLFYLTLDEAGTDAIPAGRHVFDVRVELADGTIKKRPRGQLHVLPGVTRE